MEIEETNTYETNEDGSMDINSINSNTTEQIAVEDFANILAEHQRNCEMQGKYVEAEIAKNKLDELRFHAENQRLEAMRSRQIAERLGVEEAHMLEFQHFNMVWDKKMREYETHAEQLVDEIRQKHENEFKEFQEDLLNNPPRMRNTRELLDLRRIQEHLAKMRKYKEAHKMKVKADQLEDIEREKWQHKRQREILQKETKFRESKKQELRGLQQRIQTGRDEQKKQRQLDLERLLRRYQNVKAELEAQQNLERIRASKSSQLGRLGTGKKKTGKKKKPRRKKR